MLHGGGMSFVVQKWRADDLGLDRPALACTMVGGVYVRGVMGGEALDAVKEGWL